MREQSRHPRGSIPAASPTPTTPSTTTTATPAETIAGLPVTVTQPIAEAASTNTLYEEHPVSLTHDIKLVAWQQEALGAWSDAGFRGVVESVTSEGNNQLAYWAIGRALDNSMKVLVLAPTAERVEQWYDGLRAALPINRVGKHGGKGGPRTAAYDVVVATAQAAAKEHMFEHGSACSSSPTRCTSSARRRCRRRSTSPTCGGSA